MKGSSSESFLAAHQIEGTGIIATDAPDVADTIVTGGIGIVITTVVIVGPTGTATSVAGNVRDGEAGAASKLTIR